MTITRKQNIYTLRKCSGKMVVLHLTLYITIKGNLMGLHEIPSQSTGVGCGPGPQ